MTFGGGKFGARYVTQLAIGLCKITVTGGIFLVAPRPLLICDGFPQGQAYRRPSSAAKRYRQQSDRAGSGLAALA